MIKKIVVAYDGSEQSKKAYDMALDIASKYAAQVIVLSVARPPEPPVAVETEAMLEYATEFFEKEFKSLKEKALPLGIEPTLEILVGHPAEHIVQFAKTEKADIIVMGHRGGTLFQMWRLGSVARRVMAHAHCTVMIVR